MKRERKNSCREHSAKNREVCTVDSYEEALDALNSGRHCIVQKPFASECGRVEHMQELARSKGLNLFIWKIASALQANHAGPRYVDVEGIFHAR